MIEKLRDELRQLVEELEQLQEKANGDEGLNEEEEKRFDELLTSSEETREKIDQADQRQKRAQQIQDYAGSSQGGFDPRSTNQSSRYSAQQIHTGAQDPMKFRSLGEFVQAVTLNPGDKRLRDRDIDVRQSAQDMTNDIQGGYLVPDEFSDQLLTVQTDEAIVRPRATVFGGGDADFKIPALQYHGQNMYAGASVTWISEGAEKPQTDINFRQVTLQPYEVAAHVEVTDKLMRNSNIIEQVVRTQLRGALIDAEENAFLTGSGSKPTGIIDADCTFGVTRNSNTAVDYDDLSSMYARFRGRRGVWIVSREVLPELMTLEDGANQYVWQPNARDGSPGNLFGLPVLYSDHSPALNQTGSVLLCDLSYYLIKDGVGVAIAASPHFKFTNNITVIKAFKTVDGKPWLDNVLPTTYETSPFVQLENQ